jgi:hypothetical protein
MADSERTASTATLHIRSLEPLPQVLQKDRLAVGALAVVKQPDFQSIATASCRQRRRRISSILHLLRQRVHDHGPGDRCGWPDQQGRKAVLNPR